MTAQLHHLDRGLAAQPVHWPVTDNGGQQPEFFI